MAARRALRLHANGLEFSGFEVGDEQARPVLLLHGFPQTSRAWTDVAERLAAAGLRAVAVDQRGYSPGARPADVADYATSQLVADALGMIARLGGRVDLVGHDWGGVIGWHVAARHPERVRTFTAVSTPNPLAVAEVHAAQPQEKERFAYIRALRRPGLAEEALLADDARMLRGIYGDAVPPERVAADVRTLSEPRTLTAALNWYRAMSRRDLDGLGLVTVPTSYVWGTADVAFGQAAAEASRRYVDADYLFVPVDGATHWLPDERPEVVAMEIVRRVS